MHVKYNLALCQIWAIMPIFYICCDIAEKYELILFIFGTVINQDRDLMHVKYTLAMCQNVEFMSIISYIVYVCSNISEMNQWIWFMFGTVINHHRCFMHVNYSVALCQIGCVCLFCHNCCVYITHE